MATACLVASTTAVRNPSPFSVNLKRKTGYSLPSCHSLTNLHLPILKLRNPFALPHSRLPSQTLAVRCASSFITPPLPQPIILSESSRSLFSLFYLAVAAIRRLVSTVIAVAATGASSPTPSEFAEIRSLRGDLVCSVGPLFFAAVRNRSSGHLSTPLTVVAAGMSKWLDIYSGVLLVRVLLSWFPNIPWERQPLSAIRDLCDPYLNLFRCIIPPIFDTLDVSPLLAFAVLGALGSILRTARVMP
ncbi:hypothetical protein HPP92_018407 [Vanilla planifolia]|uniref:Uncharacterized protein n=1 Tax=Vanilla planifolia TaxID=51239 RepID=A0A835QGB8_VANPL|nr:hypothetical protein HPP92_018407 [Vanilla planifolia]